jgi:hypothetical protein
MTQPPPWKNTMPGARAGAGAAIHAHRDRPRRSRDGPVRDRRDLLGRHRQPHLLEHAARLGRLDLLELHASLRGDLVEHEAGLRIERHACLRRSSAAGR